MRKLVVYILIAAALRRLGSVNRKRGDDANADSRRSDGPGEAELDALRDLTRYERSALRLQRWAMLVQFVGLLGLAASVWFVTIQVEQQTVALALQTQATRAQIEATQAQYEAIERAAYQDLMSKQLEIHKLFIEKPRLFASLFTTVAPGDQLKGDVVSAANYHLDFFQLLYSQRAVSPSLKGNSPAWVTWRNSMKEAFENSAVLCAQLRRNASMYGADFLEDAREPCAGHVSGVDRARR